MGLELTQLLRGGSEKTLIIEKRDEKTAAPVADEVIPDPFAKFSRGPIKLLKKDNGEYKYALESGECSIGVSESDLQAAKFVVKNMCGKTQKIASENKKKKNVFFEHSPNYNYGVIQCEPERSKNLKKRFQYRMGQKYPYQGDKKKYLIPCGDEQYLYDGKMDKQINFMQYGEIEDPEILAKPSPEESYKPIQDMMMEQMAKMKEELRQALISTQPTLKEALKAYSDKIIEKEKTIRTENPIRKRGLDDKVYDGYMRFKKFKRLT